MKLLNVPPFKVGDRVSILPFSGRNSVYKVVRCFWGRHYSSTSDETMVGVAILNTDTEFGTYPARWFVKAQYETVE